MSIARIVSWVIVCLAAIGGVLGIIFYDITGHIDCLSITFMCGLVIFHCYVNLTCEY